MDPYEYRSRAVVCHWRADIECQAVFIPNGVHTVCHPTARGLRRRWAKPCALVYVIPRVNWLGRPEPKLANRRCSVGNRAIKLNASFGLTHDAALGSKNDRILNVRHGGTLLGECSDAIKECAACKAG